MGTATPVSCLEPKRGYYVFWLFSKIGLCSATSFKRSRRELSIDVAEHRSMLKNNQNTYYTRSRFSFMPKTGTAVLKTRLCFYCAGFKKKRYLFTVSDIVLFNLIQPLKLHDRHLFSTGAERNKLVEKPPSKKGIELQLHKIRYASPLNIVGSFEGGEDVA